MTVAVLLVTHAELYRDKHFADTHHMGMALEKMRTVVSATLKLINKDVQGKGLAVLLMGEGSRYEDVLLEFKNQAHSYYGSHIILGQGRPDIITGISGMLGGPSSRRSSKGNMVYSTLGNPYYRDHCFLLSDYISVNDAWKFVEKVDTMHEGYKVFCSGRQLMKALGLGKYFSIASVFILNWHNGGLQCIIKDGKELLNSLDLVAR